MEAKKFAMVVKCCACAAAVGVFVLVVVAIAQFAKMGSLARKKARLERDLNYLNATQSSVKESILKHSDLNYNEQYAREHLGFIKDGDIIYEIK